MFTIQTETSVFRSYPYTLLCIISSVSSKVYIGFDAQDFKIEVEIDASNRRWRWCFKSTLKLMFQIDVEVECFKSTLILMFQIDVKVECFKSKLTLMFQTDVQIDVSSRWQNWANFQINSLVKPSIPLNKIDINLVQREDSQIPLHAVTFETYVYLGSYIGKKTTFSKNNVDLYMRI